MRLSSEDGIRYEIEKENSNALDRPTNRMNVHGDRSCSCCIVCANCSMTWTQQIMEQRSASLLRKEISNNGPLYNKAFRVQNALV
jgi:hypothetical protein